MRRRLLSLAILPLLPFALAGCSGDDDEPAAKKTPASETSEPLDGEYSQPGIAQDAETGDFCKAMAEVDDAIDEAEDDADSWLRIVTAFDEVYEVGVPEDLSPAGIAEFDRIDTLVRQSNSVAEFEAAVSSAPPQGEVMEDYLDEHCK